MTAWLRSLLGLLLWEAALARPVVRNIQSAREFERLLKKHSTETGLPVIVDFYSDGCGPCRMMAPIFKKVAKDFVDKAVFVKVDTNRQHELSSKYQIRSLPTFNYFLGGRMVHQDKGGIGEGPLRQQTESMVRQAQAENTKLTLENLQAFYATHDASKSDVSAILDKCIGFTKGSDECAGAAANQLARKLKKKYGAKPKLIPRFDPSAAKSSSSSEEKPKAKRPSKKETANLHLATVEQLQEELERRMDEAAEAADDEEDDAENAHSWTGPGEYPEKMIIIGGGPAGMAAAIYGARAGLTPLVIAPSMGGQLQGKGVDVENYPGLFNQTGPAVVSAMREQAAYFGTVFEDDVVNRIIVDRDPAKEYETGRPEPITVVTNTTGSILAHSVIIATGAEANWLGIPGEWELRGAGVSSCAVCDGFLYKGKDVIIVGGGDAAMEDALVLARTSKSVTVVHRRDKFRASKVLADRVLNHPLIKVEWNTTVHEIVGKEEATSSEGDTVDMDDVVKSVDKAILKCTATGATRDMAVDAVFIAIGHTPTTSFLEQQVDFQGDYPGYIKLQPGTTQTSVKGIFAAGDVSDAVYRQAITSAGSGAAAALDAERYLSEHGLGNEAEELAAELLADLMSEEPDDVPSYNIYDEAGGRVEGMKESITSEL